jgi:tRNA-dihydrouridine synthase
MLKIGNIEMKNNVVLAPMAGVCNPAFRLIAKEFGTGLVCAEMVSDKAILHGNKRTMEMLFVDERESRLACKFSGATANRSSKLQRLSISRRMLTLSTSIWDVRFRK